MSDHNMFYNALTDDDEPFDTSSWIRTISSKLSCSVHSTTRNHLKLLILPVFWIIIVLAFYLPHFILSYKNFYSDSICYKIVDITDCINVCMCGWNVDDDMCVPIILFNPTLSPNWTSVDRGSDKIFCQDPYSFILLVLFPVVVYLFVIFSYDLSQRIALKLLTYCSNWKAIDIISKTFRRRQSQLDDL